MASFNIHLAIANKYLVKNHINNKKEFYNGIIDPDLVENKIQSHYTDLKSKNLLIPYLEGKAQLNKFLLENDIDTDYNKGVFLHLITDYLFFKDFFDNDYLINITYDDFVKDLFYSYKYVNNYLENKYKLDLNQFGDKLTTSIKNDINTKKSECNDFKNILEFDKLDLFIEKVSSVNLNEYKAKIILNNKNVII